MSSLRVILLATLANFAVLVWLVVGCEQGRGGVSPAQDTGMIETQRLREELRAIGRNIEEMRVALTDWKEAYVAHKSAARVPVEQEPTADLKSELQAIHLAIRSLLDAQADVEAGHQSQNLEEIRRTYPSTKWDAVNAVIQRAMAAPGGKEQSYFDGEESPALRALLMLRPKQLLEQFGAPSKTRIEQERFVWYYESPNLRADSEPEFCLEITFDKGYVWKVFFSTP
jgi:hypothetical protein